MYLHNIGEDLQQADGVVTYVIINEVWREKREEKKFVSCVFVSWRWMLLWQRKKRRVKCFSLFLETSQTYAEDLYQFTSRHSAFQVLSYQKADLSFFIVFFTVLCQPAVVALLLSFTGSTVGMCHSPVPHLFMAWFLSCGILFFFFTELPSAVVQPINRLCSGLFNLPVLRPPVCDLVCNCVSQLSSPANLLTLKILVYKPVLIWPLPLHDPAWLWKLFIHYFWIWICYEFWILDCGL